MVSGRSPLGVETKHTRGRTLAVSLHDVLIHRRVTVFREESAAAQRQDAFHAPQKSLIPQSLQYYRGHPRISGQKGVGHRQLHHVREPGRTGLRQGDDAIIGFRRQQSRPSVTSSSRQRRRSPAPRESRSPPCAAVEPSITPQSPVSSRYSGLEPMRAAMLDTCTGDPSRNRCLGWRTVRGRVRRPGAAARRPGSALPKRTRRRAPTGSAAHPGARRWLRNSRC